MHQPHPLSHRPIRYPRRLLRAAMAAALLPMLAACGMVGAMIPAVDVGDPLGVQGRVIAAQVQDGPIATRAITHVDRTTSMDLPDLEQDLRGFRIAALYVGAGFSDEVRLSGANFDAAPQTFTIDRAVIEATLADDRDGSVTFHAAMDLDLTFEKATCDATGCTYRYTGDTDLAHALDLDLTDRAQLDRLVKILVARGEPTPNTGSFRVAVQFDGDTSLAGYTVRFTLESEGTKLKLG